MNMCVHHTDIDTQAYTLTHSDRERDRGRERERERGRDRHSHGNTHFLAVGELELQVINHLTHF